MKSVLNNNKNDTKLLQVVKKRSTRKRIKLHIRYYMINPFHARLPTGVERNITRVIALIFKAKQFLKSTSRHIFEKVLIYIERDLYSVYFKEMNLFESFIF